MKDTVVEKLTARFSESIEFINEYRGELTVVLKKKAIVDVCRFLHDDDELHFDSLRDLLGADYYRPDDRYEVVYNLFSLKNKFRLRLKVRIDESDLHVLSVTSVWSGANWQEREAYDMFGIVFDDHPDLRRMYMPEEFEHHPLRKDFPLMGIPGSLALPRK
ncbi:MAG: NADH-quinone oxidoreductase subunit C [Ignavibacteriae bacterium]|nr:NADH-quinone oxidoreductase subunit C [Ignavibacteria bacterium]MBI3364919.1 NADH-quinone oxidoreductase subunit C [Ignavibacteriota bacterium]